MFYDLNVPWMTSQVELQRTLLFLAELGYNVIALNHTITGKVPTDLASPIPSPLSFMTPRNLHILRRCTLTLSDPSQNHRLASLASNYDIIALRPTTEKALQLACQTLDCDLISLDLSTRFPFHFKHKTLSLALSHGIKFEICYAAGVLDVDDGMGRRNLISNATSLIGATRGRGIVLSSEARRALACRGPWDVVNLAAVWGLGQERGREAIGREARAVVVQAEMKRRSFRGVVDIVYGGEKPEMTEKVETVKGKIGKEGKAAKISKSIETAVAHNKRKADVMEDGNTGEEETKPISKREQKRREKKARLEAATSEKGGKTGLNPKGPASLEKSPRNSMENGTG